MFVSGIPARCHRIVPLDVTGVAGLRGRDEACWPAPGPDTLDERVGREISTARPNYVPVSEVDVGF